MRRSCHDRALIARTAALGLLYQGLVVLAFWCGARAVELELPFALIACVAPVVLVLTALPISLAGFGVREGTYAVMLGTADVATTDGALVSLTTVVVVAIASLPGALAIVFRRRDSLSLATARARYLGASMRRHRGLIGVLVAGAAVRIGLMFAYSPAYLSYPDTWGYAKAAAGPLFMEDWIRPAGYPALLAALHGLWGELRFAIAAQHVLGLAAAALAYAVVLRAGAPRGVALIPAAVVALNLDFVYFEHSLLSEGPFCLLLLACVYATVRAVEEPLRLAWAVAAGVLAAALITFRGAGLFAVPVLVVAVALAGAVPWRRRLAGAVTLLATCGALILGYAALQSTQNGYFGLTEGNGWQAYGRAAPFANCTGFTPPKGTESLCESTHAGDRPGPDFYVWDPRSPARRLSGGPPHNADVVGAFGRAAILGQPRAYVSAVATDLWRYVVPHAGIDRDDDGATPAEVSIAARRPVVERGNLTTVEPLYGDVEVKTGDAVEVYGDLQQVVRAHGPLLLAAVLLAAAALPFADGRRRLAIVVLAGAGLAPVVMATLTVIYDWRYMVPSAPLIMAAGALGAWVLAGRVRAAVASRRRWRGATA